MDSKKNLPYVRPELRCYGAITKVVQGRSGLGLDGASGRARR
ncbi:hypothetical protein [Aeromicrobium sp. NPDC092404]